jgi:alkanesulfonate monooxygenase SsuD/methylene tetrahydromethanopterin reductase-like flavin-dependent oxidoreductase (luciferase family)
VAERVEFGVYVPQLAFGFDDVLSRAQLCEELGFSSFWLYDHLYGPGLPDQPALEGWTLATALLALTSTIRVGHLVVNNNLRHPVLLGKMATTLDVISKGRLELGIGSGSYEAEHHEGGFEWGSLRERSERLGEALEILTRMFTGERTSFEGNHYRVADIPNLPPPVQSPRPPIHVGGVGERFTLPLVARYADVWNVPTYGLARWEAVAPTLAAECEKLGRDPASVRRSLEAVLVVAPDEASLAAARGLAERRYRGPAWGLEDGGFIGTPQAVVDRIGEQIDKGITLFVFFIHDRGEPDTLRLLAEEVVTHFT